MTSEEPELLQMQVKLNNLSLKQRSMLPSFAVHYWMGRSFVLCLWKKATTWKLFAQRALTARIRHYLEQWDRLQISWIIWR